MKHTNECRIIMYSHGKKYIIRAKVYHPTILKLVLAEYLNALWKLRLRNMKKWKKSNVISLGIGNFEIPIIRFNSNRDKLAFYECLRS